MAKSRSREEVVMRFRATLFGAVALFVLVGPLAATRAMADYADECLNGTGDEKIAACARAIKSGRWRSRDLAGGG